MTVDIVALICALGQSPVECQPPTAVEMLPLGNVTNELRCMFEGQQRLAQVSDRIPPDHYAKIMCLKHEDEKL